MENLKKEILVEYLISEIGKLEYGEDRFVDYYEYYYKILCDYHENDKYKYVIIYPPFTTKEMILNFGAINNIKDDNYKNILIKELNKNDRSIIIDFMKDNMFYGEIKLVEEVLNRKLTLHDIFI